MNYKVKDVTTVVVMKHIPTQITVSAQSKREASKILSGILDKMANDKIKANVHQNEQKQP